MKNFAIGVFLGCVLLLIIGAASVDKVGRFQNIQLGGTTNLISDSGTSLTRNGVDIGGGGDTIWNNTDGVIAPASGQDTNVLRFTSGLADNATNIATRIGSANAWSIESKSLALHNGNTNVAWFNAQGGLNIGRTSADNWGSTGGLTIFKDDAADEGLGAEIVVGHTDGGSIFRYVDIQGETLPLIDIHYDGENVTRLRPATSDGNTAYIFDTVVSQSSGSLATFGNNGTNKVAFARDGAVIAAQVATEPAAPDAGYYTLFATNVAGKMTLKVRFPTGASQTIATEP